MIQAMQILQLPSLDLEERIEQELTENPFLERTEGQETQEGEAEPPARDEEARPEGVEAMIDLLERYDRDFGDGASTRATGGDEADRKLEAMANAPRPPQGLAEAILDQIVFLPIADEDRALLEYIVWSLDDRGYLPTDREELAEELCRELERPVEAGDVEAALEELRTVTHPSLGARDLRDALLLQLDATGFDGVLVRKLITDHLEDIEANRLPRIVRETGAAMEDVKEAIEHIRHLDPTPGSGYGDSPGEVIIPDVVVEEVDGEFVVRLERERSGGITLSPIYRQILKDAEKGDGAKEWVKKRLESARWFLDALQQRESTLSRIAKAIFSHQDDFLRKGPGALRPLRMQEVADEIGIHISTVSRGVSGKYAQTPRGIFPLKFFFTGGTTKDSGEVASQVSIKERIKALVEDEDPSSPLSDEQLGKLLEEKDGIRIARRTVTKYRKALDIPSSSQRRSY